MISLFLCDTAPHRDWGALLAPLEASLATLQPPRRRHDPPLLVDHLRAPLRDALVLLHPDPGYNALCALRVAARKQRLRIVTVAMDARWGCRQLPDTIYRRQAPLGERDALLGPSLQDFLVSRDLDFSLLEPSEPPASLMTTYLELWSRAQLSEEPVCHDALAQLRERLPDYMACEAAGWRGQLRHSWLENLILLRRPEEIVRLCERRSAGFRSMRDALAPRGRFERYLEMLTRLASVASSAFHPSSLGECVPPDVEARLAALPNPVGPALSQRLEGFVDELRELLIALRNTIEGQDGAEIASTYARLQDVSRALHGVLGQLPPGIPLP